ncbi:MAG: plasma-membrane proton-efflux P-type ATPase [Alphaproteobacteria bacterium]|nr:MAG: plasma-membrane proton-efflux P-type ATPase [Alphaproteobacteria bacterium]
MDEAAPESGGRAAEAEAAAPATELSTGLSGAEAARRLAQYGPNAIEERRRHPVLRFLGYFWGPIPWMVEAAAILSALVRHWVDFFIILTLLVFNAAIGFWQEFKAANALEALKRGLALKARVLRDGRWQQIAARDLVPGDVVGLRLGDVVPADIRLVDGEYLSVDQSALTGESLPVAKKAGDDALSGSIVKQGEMVGVVTATGGQTFFGRTAKLVESAGATSHFQQAVLRIGNFLIVSSLILAAILVAVELYRGAPVLELLQFVLILIVASIPVAMPAVLSVTMALGALALSRERAIVTRLQSIEEMAGMDVLCSDKTGTLTQNRLTLGEPVLFAARDAQELYLAAALASKEENGDAIDLAVIAGLDDRAALAGWRRTGFTPFDPVSKRSEARVANARGETLLVTKGAPQVIAALGRLTGDDAARAEAAVEEFAARGYRALGVARSADGGASWQFLGLLSLFDPPRDTAAETIARAREHGVTVKMVTGDDVAIAREIAGRLGMGRNIEPATGLFGDDGNSVPPDVAERVAAADGFARVFPEHKYEIVRALQARGHIVGMTGDGVNDSPAIKQADVGIAVSGATDAARAAADLVLTRPGLSTIVNAIEEARRIFERMNSYAIYRINETIRAMIFIVLSLILFGIYPITAVMIILLAIFNDVAIMAIAYDNTPLQRRPVRWEMRRVMTVASVMGLTGTLGSIAMLLLARDVLALPLPQIQTYVFLKLMVAGHFALFVARARGRAWARPWPSPILLAAILGTDVAATLLAVHPMGLMAPIGWVDVGIIWAFALTNALITDTLKVATYRWLDARRGGGDRHSPTMAGPSRSG